MRLTCAPDFPIAIEPDFLQKLKETFSDKEIKIIKEIINQIIINNH